MLLGRYEFDERGTSCFRPGVPSFPDAGDVADLVDAAGVSVRILDRRLGEWPEPEVVGRLFARLDAVSSSGAEGSTTTFTDLLEYESALRSAPDVVDAAGVAVLSDAASMATGGGLLPLVLGLHARLFEMGDARVAALAGTWKARVNRTVDADAPGGLFAYALPSSVPSCMGEWERFVLDGSPRTSEAVRQCLGHWTFEHVHPVHDGNGRIGRLLVPLVMRRKGFTRHACAFVSEGVYHDKELYVEALKSTRVTGDTLGWARLMLGFMDQGARDNLRRLDGLLALKGQWEREARGLRSDSVVHRLVPYALTRPAFTVRDALADVGGSFASVNDGLARMVRMGLLEVAGDARRDRLFRAPAVLDLFDHFRAVPTAEHEGGGPPGP